MNIGIILIATDRYTEFIPNLLRSIELYFLTNHNVTVYLFTDTFKNVGFHYNLNIKIFETKHLKWPYMTLYRYKIIDKCKKHFISEDYLYYLDVDTLIISNIGEEILSYLVGVIHPSFKALTPGHVEKNILSAAYIENPNHVYHAGGFQGGKTKIFIAMCTSLACAIDTDLQNNIIAIYHDESHFNRYIHDNNLSLSLDWQYLWPECWSYREDVKILVLDKNHTEYHT